MKWWPTLLLASAIFFIASLYTPKQKQYIEMLDDGCLIHSLYYKQSMLAQEMLGQFIWSRVLAIHFYGNLGHAVTVFIYENNTYVYDPNRGSFPVAGYPMYDPLSIAEICFPKASIKRAYYLEPTFLLHYRNDRFNMN